VFAAVLIALQFHAGNWYCVPTLAEPHPPVLQSGNGAAAPE